MTRFSELSESPVAIAAQLLLSCSLPAKVKKAHSFQIGVQIE